jgi:hypothetical protein
VWSFLQRWRYFDILRECVDDPLNLLPKDQHEQLLITSKYSRAVGSNEDGETADLMSPGRVEISIVALNTDRSVGSESTDTTIASYSDPLLRASLRKYCRWSHEDIDDFVTGIVPHTVRNLEHSRGSFGLVATRIDSKWLTLAVIDNGIGIPALLREGLISGSKSDSDLIQLFADRELIEESIRSIRDSDLVVASTERGVTTLTDPERRRGLGLFYLKRGILSRGGELRIRSGSAEVTFDGADVQPFNDRLIACGTSIRVLLPVVSANE